MKRKLIETEFLSNDSFDESVTSGSIYEPSSENESDDTDMTDSTYEEKKIRKKERKVDVLNGSIFDQVTLSVSNDSFIEGNNQYNQLSLSSGSDSNFLDDNLCAEVPESIANDIHPTSTSGFVWLEPCTSNNDDDAFSNFEILSEEQIASIFSTEEQVDHLDGNDSINLLNSNSLQSAVFNDIRDDRTKYSNCYFENPSNPDNFSNLNALSKDDLICEETVKPPVLEQQIPVKVSKNHTNINKAKTSKPDVKKNHAPVTDPVAKKLLLDSSSESLNLSINLKAVGEVLKNKKNAVLLTSKDGIKKNACYYCVLKKLKTGDIEIKVLFANLVEHYEASHSAEKHVIALTKIKKVVTIKGQPRPQQLTDRIEILDYLRNKGNFLNNLHANDVSEYVVSRRPTAVGATVANYGTCLKCFKQLSLTSIHKHVSKCTGTSFKKRHIVKSSSKVIMGNYHEKASDEAIKILSHMRESDDVLDEIRYDDVACIWLNAEASRYEKAPHNHNKVRANFRRLGMLLQFIKVYNDEINELADIFHENNYDDFILAVKHMGKQDPVTKEMKAPATASDMFHLIKSVTSIYDVMLGEKNTAKRLIVQAFQRKMIRMWHSSIGNTIAEQQAENNRNKLFKEPSQTDLVLLRKYLSDEMVKSYNALKKQYTDSGYENLRNVLGCYLQMTNVRRVGEVERFRMSEFQRITIKEKSCRVEVRGKRTKPVPIVFGLNLHQYLILLVKNRSNARISSNNPFVFARINDLNDDFQFADLGSAMAQFADLCGAEEPTTLRGTSFRKQIATDRLRKGISDKGVENLSSFMGHTPRIHCQNYQQAVFERDIATSKMVKESQTNTSVLPGISQKKVQVDSNEEGDFFENESTEEEFSSIQNIEDVFNTKTNLHAENCKENIKEIAECIPSENDQEPAGNEKQGKKLPWKQHSIDALLAKFPNCLELTHPVPSAAEIKKFIRKTDDIILKQRKEPQIRSWIHTQRKHKKTSNDLPQRNNVPGYIYAAFQSYIDAKKEPSPRTCGKFIALSPSRANLTINNIQNWVKLAIKRKSM